MDIEAIVAEKWRADHGILADMRETFAQQLVPVRDRQR
jgi:hypothetical protein